MRRTLPLVLLFGGCATWRALFPEPPAPGWPPSTIVIPVPQARAIDVAYADFAADKAKLRAEVEQERAATDAGFTPAELAERECTHRPDFYEGWLYLDDAGTRYVVAIEPKFELCFDPSKAEIYGGGVIYEIDARDFTVLKKESEE